MRPLAWDDFAGTEGSIYSLDAGDRQIPLTLETLAELPASGRTEGAFRLEFRGPFEPVLGQAIYPLVRGDRSFQMFLVPIGREERGTRYEAVFF